MEFLSGTQPPPARLKMSDFKAQVEVAVMVRGGRQHGNEIRFRCPCHEDSHPSAGYNIAKGVWICRVCGESGNWWHLGRLLGIISNGHRLDGWRETRRWNIGQATHKHLVRLAETDRGLVLTHQLPNRYWTWCPRGSSGLLPKVARMLRVSDQSFIRGEATSTTDRIRRYYRDFKSLLRAALRGNATEGYYPSRTSSRKYILGAIW